MALLGGSPGKMGAMPNRMFAFALFLSSYAPAFFILAVRCFGRSEVMFWAAIALLGLALLAYATFLEVIPRGGKFRARVIDVDPHDGELAAYVATYLLPFVMVFDAGVQDAVAFTLFFFFIGIVWVGAGLYYLNPLLTLVGIHVYMVRVRPVSDPSSPADTLPRSFLLIKRIELQEGDEIQVQSMGRSVLTALGEPLWRRTSGRK